MPFFYECYTNFVLEKGTVMTIRHLRIFAAVYRAENVTHAAEELHLTQPAVTRAVQELEQYYGTRLFERMYRHLSPTEAGRRLYPQAVHLLDIFDRIETGLRDWDSLGVIRVGATVTLGGTLLPPLARRFAAEYPGIELQVTVANGETLTAALCENRLDLALLENGPALPDLHTEEIGTDRLCAVMAPDNALAATASLTLEQLSAAPLLVREAGSTARAVLQNALEGQGLPLHAVWESVSTEALLQAAAEGLGVAVLPESRVQGAVQAARVCLRPIAGNALVRHHVAAWHKEKYLTASMQRFLALCRSGPQQEG